MPEGQSGIVESAPAKVRSIMPPYLVLRDFLDQETVAGLLAHALAREADFAPTRTGRAMSDGGVRPNIRISTGTRNLGPFRPILKDKILKLVPDWVEKLRVTAVEAPKIETELVAHNEGAFYKRHVDTQTASNRNHLRVLSGVYYFHAEPKAFTGGALRLYAIGGADAPFVDIEPERNSLLVFPSSAPHGGQAGQLSVGAVCRLPVCGQLLGACRAAENGGIKFPALLHEKVALQYNLSHYRSEHAWLDTTGVEGTG